MIQFDEKLIKICATKEKNELVKVEDNYLNFNTFILSQIIINN